MCDTHRQKDRSEGRRRRDGALREQETERYDKQILRAFETHCGASHYRGVEKDAGSVCTTR